MFVFIFLIINTIVPIESDDVSRKNPNHSNVFSIFTEGCVIPSFPLVGENIKDIVDWQNNTIDCSKHYPLLKSNESHIWVDDSVLVDYYIMEKSQFFCCYESFHANAFVEDITYESCEQFLDTIEARHQFVRVECYYLDRKCYDDFFIFAKIKQKIYGKDFKKFNIIIFGLESVSRLNFLRTMPETANFLRTRGSIQLLGYNKLGDNSFPNLFPLLMGRSFKDAKKFCIYSNNTIDTKLCEFIWDRFKRFGYVTALGSDSIAGLLGTYEYSLSNIPTDYYLQPFIFESRKLFNNKDYNFHICYQNKYYYVTLLDYVLNLSRNLKDNNLFGMFWEESVSHEKLNYPHMMDSQYLSLLEQFENSGYLDQSVIVFFSDHGMRWGEIVLTEQGRLEERLPLVEIHLPPKFKDIYKLAHKNLQTNSRRLTTPYDMYATLVDLIDPTFLHDHEILERNRKEKYDSKTSLFLSLAKNRTCEFVGISEHWCTCYQGKMLPSGNRARTRAARYLISYINSLLDKFPQCQKLIVKNILDVSVLKDSRGATYKVVIEAFPGGGIFDSTLRRERGVWVVSGTISRLNLYRGQSGCISDTFIKLYCYCNGS